MLQLKNIKKEYRTSGLTQRALNDVSVTFRDSEFAAILGPSGSGKTTTLLKRIHHMTEDLDIDPSSILMVALPKHWIGDFR